MRLSHGEMKPTLINLTLYVIISIKYAPFKAKYNALIPLKGGRLKKLEFRSEEGWTVLWTLLHVSYVDDVHQLSSTIS